MRFLHGIWITGLLASAAANTVAQTMKPGLWEITSKMADSSGEVAAALAEVQKEMEKLPPEQRKMMESVMAQNGASLGVAGGAMTVKICLTPEMIKQNDLAQDQDNCKHSTSPRVGNTIKFSVTCSNPTSSGEGVITISSPEAYRTQMTLKTTQNGKTETMKLDSSSRFVSGNCGNIKPIGVVR